MKPKEESTEQSAKAIKPYHRPGLPRGKPGDYRMLVVRKGETVGLNTILKNLDADFFERQTWEKLGQWLRNEYGNIPLHVRCYGGRWQRVEWYVPPRYSWAQEKGERGIPVGDIISLQDENVTLREENARLRQEIKGIENGNPSKVVFNLNGEPIAEPETEKEEPGIVESFLADAIKEVGPILLGAIRSKVTQSIPHTMPTMNDQPTPQPQPMGDNDFYDIPEVLCEFLDRIDWTKTNPLTLMQAVADYSAQLGVVFKPQAVSPELPFAPAGNVPGS